MDTRRPWILAAALAFPLVLTLGCDDDDNGSGPEASLLIETFLDGDGGLVTVTDGGVAVTGADVSVNGTAATPGAADGDYLVTLAPPLAPGDPVTLDVTDGTATVEGTGTVPEAPAITAPADAATFDPGDPIEVTWTSGSDPSGGFLVQAVGDASVESFPVAGGGAARTHTIPGGTLGEGDWEILVIAVNLGTLTGDTEAGSEMQIGAEAATTPLITVGPGLLLIRGGDMGPVFNHVGLSLGGAAVDGATVTVNGEAALQGAPGDEYHVQLATPVAVGGQLDLDVTLGIDVYQGLGNVPEPPVVTAPADAASFAAADPIQVNWTSTADPDRFGLFVDGPTGFVDLEIAGNLRTFTILGGTLTAGTYTISVLSYEDGVFTGPANPNSRMSIRGELGPFPEITVTP